MCFKFSLARRLSIKESAHSTLSLDKVRAVKMIEVQEKNRKSQKQEPTEEGFEISKERRDDSEIVIKKEPERPKVSFYLDPNPEECKSSLL